jgi:hypothetical protein
VAIPDITPHDGRTGYNLVWDPNGLVWVQMQQPILNAGSVTLSGTVDVSDRVGRLLGHVTVDAMPAITGTVTANAGSNLNTSLLALEAGHLATIDTSTAKIPSQGQALGSASMPVVLPAAQVTTLTPPTTVAVTNASLDGTPLATIDTDIKSNITLHAGTNVIGHVIVDSDTSLPALGPAPISGALPVAIASDQVVPVTLLRVNERTLNLGKQNAEDSIPVVLAVDQPVINVALTDGLDSVGTVARPLSVQFPAVPSVAIASSVPLAVTVASLPVVVTTSVPSDPTQSFDTTAMRNLLMEHRAQLYVAFQLQSTVSGQFVPVPEIPAFLAM